MRGISEKICVVEVDVAYGQRSASAPVSQILDLQIMLYTLVKDVDELEGEGGEGREGRENGGRRREKEGEGGRRECRHCKIGKYS
jgi:hypothetical protein